MTDRRAVSWDEVATMCHTLAERLAARPFDVILAVARGGLVPAALVAQELGLRRVLAAAVASYQGDRREEALHFLEFPPDETIAGRQVLVVDDIWDTGRTADLVRRRIVAAGGRPTVAVLHYKPARSHFERGPDVWLSQTDEWILYPWERDT